MFCYTIFFLSTMLVLGHSTLAPAGESATVGDAINDDEVIVPVLSSSPPLTSFCKRFSYAELALCQFRAQLAQLGNLLSSVTEEIDFLSEGTAEQRTVPGAVPMSEKRAISAPAGTDPVLAQLAAVTSSSSAQNAADDMSWQFRPNGWHGWMFGLRRAGKLFGIGTTDKEAAARHKAQQRQRRPSSGSLRIWPAKNSAAPADQQQTATVGPLFRQLFKMA